MRPYDELLNKYPCGLWNFRDKENVLLSHVKYMLARTQSMFKYEGLPETIPARILELYLQCSGYVGIFRYRENLYACYGGLGGEPDYNYMPTIFTVANPALGYSANLKINDECIIIKSDSMYQGLMPMFRKYGTAMLENELSMNLVSINARIQSIISASDDRTKESAEHYLKKVWAGDLGIIGDVPFFENLKTSSFQNASSNNVIKPLIEYEQYLKASEWNEIGLDANYNMKRETLTDSENEMNRDSLLPLIDDMLSCRKEGVKAVNDMFGTSIKVSFASAWEDNQEELEAVQDALENASEGSETAPDEKDPEENDDDNREIE